MTHRQEIIIYARNTAGLMRIAQGSRHPANLMQSITARIDRLVRYARQSIDSTPEDKQTAERCVSAILRIGRL